MILTYVKLPRLAGPAGDDYHGSLPKRALLAHPLAVESILKMEAETGGMIYTDMYRSAEASLAAMQAKVGVQRPGYSGHNFGLSFDLDLEGTQAWLEKTYSELVDYLGSNGWFCHRRDKLQKPECWHFNYLGDGYEALLRTADKAQQYTWGQPLQNLIQSLYGGEFELTVLQIQEALIKCGLYNGELDGIWGPLTAVAIAAFQRAWLLPEQVGPDKVVGSRTQRTLAFVTATVKIV